MDEKISELADDADMIVLPGGMPGVTNLIANEKVRNLVCGQYEAGRYVAAICAAPTAFGAFGILKDKKATCYPGMEAGLHCAELFINILKFHLLQTCKLILITQILLYHSNFFPLLIAV